MAWSYSDNQPHYTSREPEEGYKSIMFKTICRNEEIFTDPEDPCDPTLQKLLVEYKDAQGMVSKRDKERTIARYYTHGCHCEGDCCGHRHGGATVEIISDKYALVEVYSSRNY